MDWLIDWSIDWFFVWINFSFYLYYLSDSFSFVFGPKKKIFEIYVFNAKLGNWIAIIFYDQIIKTSNLFVLYTILVSMFFFQSEKNICFDSDFMIKSIFFSSNHKKNIPGNNNSKNKTKKCLRDQCFLFANSNQVNVSFKIIFEKKNNLFKQRWN